MQVTIRIVPTAIGSEIFMTAIMTSPSPVCPPVGHVIGVWETRALAIVGVATDGGWLTAETIAVQGIRPRSHVCQSLMILHSTI